MLKDRLRRLEKLARKRKTPDPSRTVEELTDRELAAVIDPADPAAALKMSDPELARVAKLRPKRRRQDGRRRPVQAPLPPE